MIRSKIVCRTAALVIVAAAALSVGVSPAARINSSGEELFNGKDFTGWKFSNKQTEVWKVVSTVKYDPKDPNQPANYRRTAPMARASCSASSMKKGTEPTLTPKKTSAIAKFTSSS